MKNLVFELDQTIRISRLQHWTPHTSNIYKITYSWQSGEAVSIAYGLTPWGWGPYGIEGTGPIIRSERDRTLKVGSVIVDEFSYTAVDNVEDLDVIDRSFHFDITKQILYVRFEDDKAPWQFEYIVVGTTLGFSQIMTYYNDVFYDSRIVAGPDLTYSTDPLIFGKLAIDTFTIQLNNTDRFFDALDQVYPYGNAVRIFYGEVDDEFENFEQVFSGFFEDFSIDSGICTIVGSDDRKRLSVDVEGELIDQDDYPNMKEGEHHKPLVYGRVSKMECIPLDDDNNDLFNYRFQFFDRDYFNNNPTIHNVYVDNVLLTSYSALNNGILTISNLYYEPGQIVSVDMTGSDIDHPLEVIEHLMFKFPGYDYNDFYYNLDEWEEAKSKALQPIGIAITEPESLFDVIEKICNTVFGSFIAWPDGRFSFKLRDITLPPAKVVQPIDFLEEPEIEFNQDEYLSSLRILYDKQYALDEYLAYTLDKDRKKVAALYNRQRTIELETLFVNRQEAKDAADSIYDQFAGIFPTITMVLKLESIDVYVGDVIDAYVALLRNGQYGAIRLEVVSVSFDFNTHRYTLTGRYINWLFDYENEFVRYISNEEVRELAPYE